MLKEEFLKKITEEKEERKKQRLLARGFKAPEPVEDDAEPEPDPEIEEEAEDFDKEAHEKEVFKGIFDTKSVLVIDGDWFDLPEDEIATEFTDLLFNSRRAPELVISLSVSEENMLTRLLDKDTIEAKYQELVEQRNEEKRKQREQDRAEKLEELKQDEEKPQEEIDQEMEEWDKERDEQEAEDDDPDAPNLEAMLEEEKEKLVENRNTHTEFIEGFEEKVSEMKVPVVKVNGDLEIERVYLRILAQIKSYFEERNSMYERSQVVDLKAEEVKFYENSYLFSQSKYGYRSLFDIARPDFTKQYSLIYRDQLYFFTTQDEKDQFKISPEVYCKNEAVPKDVLIKPTAFVLGAPASGKSTICQQISKRTSMVHIKIEDLVPEFIEAESDLGERLREEVKRGEQISDFILVSMISLRVQYSDCVRYGYLLEDFPKTADQAAILGDFGIIPDYVFYLEMDSEKCYDRVKSLSTTEFMYENRVMAERLDQHFTYKARVIGHYEHKYGNVQYINGLKSKWFVQEKILTHIRNSIACKSKFARDIPDPKKACALEHINFNRSLFELSHSAFKTYCPVTWKHHETFNDSKFMEKTAVLFQDPTSKYICLYFFRSLAQRDIFMASPQQFSDSKLFSSEIPERVAMHNAAQIISKEKNLANYCPVTLLEDGKVEKGYQLHLALYGGKFEGLII